MANTTLRVQASAPLYGDVSQTMSNTWYFDGAPSTTRAEDGVEAMARLAAFYAAIDGVLYPSSVVGSTISFEVYDMGDTPPRVPIDSISGPLTASGGTAYPSDIAICLSYRGVYTSGVNRARRRGRVYLGPLLASVGVAVSGQGMRVTTGVITAILDAAELLATTIVDPITWVMWSETDQVSHPIVLASVDNGFDTRRTRDNPATTRTERDIP